MISAASFLKDAESWKAWRWVPKCCHGNNQKLSFIILPQRFSIVSRQLIWGSGRRHFTFWIIYRHVNCFSKLSIFWFTTSIFLYISLLRHHEFCFIISLTTFFADSFSSASFIFFVEISICFSHNVSSTSFWKHLLFLRTSSSNEFTFSFTL